MAYNRVFGYYIEVTKSNLHLLEDGRYERKQTLANAERFITPELKENEGKNVNFTKQRKKVLELEYDLVCASSGVCQRVYSTTTKI